ncbi:MAG TPA: DUF460 domain-containing protein [Halobacteriales archaeon]|nr:DUF460 domain-containing protein [Halobacteriales archaeon]
MSTRTSALDTLVFGVDVQSGDVRGDAPSYALAAFDGESVERDVVSRRKLLRLVGSEAPDLLATDNVYELAEDKDALIYLLGGLPDGTRLVQVTGAERPEPLSRVASRHGVPYAKDPMSEAEAAARLAARSVGHEVTAFTDTTQVKVSRGRSTGKGGWSEDRYTRRIHGSVRRRAREVESELDDAGLDFEVDVTEKYGGYANAVFSVSARPGDIPVSRNRSGDVRVEVERERRDGIEFEPLAKRRDPVIVGVDPGTTTAVAVLDLDGNVLDVLSTRTADNAEVVEWIIERGRPLVFAADVSPMPGTVEKLRRSFEAADWAPDSDLPVDEKLHRTRDCGYDNDHERDALAAALFAADDHADQFDRVRAAVPPTVDVDEVLSRVVAGEESVEAVLADLQADERPDEEPATERPNEPSPEQRRIRQLEGRVERLTEHVDDLEETVAAKDERVEELEAQLADARREERRDARERREVARLSREKNRLGSDLEDERERVSALEAKLERLKELWRLDHSNFADVSEKRRGLVPVKPVEQFTVEAIEAADAEFGLAKGDVLLLRDATGAGRQTAERLADVGPRAVLTSGGLTDVSRDVLFERGVPFGPADGVAVQEVDDLAVAREADVEVLVDDWDVRAEERRRAENAEMVDRLISEQRAERRGAAPSELLDS